MFWTFNDNLTSFWTFLLAIVMQSISSFLFRYQLMLKCWSYRADERPTFRYCLDVLQSLRTKFEDIRINMENTSRNFSGKLFRLIYLHSFIRSFIGMESKITKIIFHNHFCNIHVHHCFCDQTFKTRMP